MPETSCTQSLGKGMRRASTRRLSASSRVILPSAISRERAFTAATRLRWVVRLGTLRTSLIFGGTLRSALAAALAGFLASGYLLLCEQHELPGGFCKISCAALITLVCILACRMLGTPASHSIIGSLMILTPGIAFTMGIRDFVHGDYLSGTIRMIDALLIAASIAIGTGLVLSLYTFFTGVVVA